MSGIIDDQVHFREPSLLIKLQFIANLKQQRKMKVLPL